VQSLASGHFDPVKTCRHWLYTAVPLTAVFFSVAFLLDAAWIPVKAEMAQWLIERNWRARVQGEPAAPPWPWADTRAAGVLSAPRLGIRQIVLEGDSGRNLAFGPVIRPATLHGHDRVVSGHRDTHFRFLADLAVGDIVTLELEDGLQAYEVRELEVVDSRRHELVIEPGVSRLSLVSCYPFDSPVAGGPLRFVVTALPVKAKVSRRSFSSG
jgi:sortase A